MSDRPKLPDLWGSQEGDSVAAVNPVDLRNVWGMLRDSQARAGGQQGSIDSTAFERVCSPGADVMAVWYRASMLGVLQMWPESPLTPWTHNGELDDAVFQVAATFPMKNMVVGFVHDDLPFDVQEFLKQIGART